MSGRLYYLTIFDPKHHWLMCGKCFQSARTRNQARKSLLYLGSNLPSEYGTGRPCDIQGGKNRDLSSYHDAWSGGLLCPWLGNTHIVAYLYSLGDTFPLRYGTQVAGAGARKRNLVGCTIQPSRIRAFVFGAVGYVPFVMWGWNICVAGLLDRG